MSSTAPRRSGPVSRKEATPPPTVTPPPMGAVDPLVGREIAGHQVLQRVATGRLCSTYKAHHAAMGRLVALKVLSPDADQNTIARFHQTARQAAQLHHANIASIYDVNAEGGVNFCAMEFVEGQTLGELFRARKKVPSADAIRVAIEVAEALRFANARGVPGWRLSANRVVITRRGEVKLLPPSFAPPGAPVLDDAYVVVATGVLLYAMLSGGRVHDIEYALEPGSKAAKQLEPVRNAVPGIRRDIAMVVERMLGLAGERFSSAEAALSALRGLLAAKEQSESRTRKLSDSARVRSQRTRTTLYIAIGAVGIAAVLLFAFIFARSRAHDAAVQRFNAATNAEAAAVTAFNDAWTAFLANPTEDRAKEACAHLDKARAEYAAVARDYPNHPRGQAALEKAQYFEAKIAERGQQAKEELRHAAGRAELQKLDKALEADIARHRKQGGKLDLEAWRKRYIEVRDQFRDSPKTVAWVKAKLKGLPQRILDEQVRIDSDAIASDVLNSCLPKLQYGKAIEAWEEHRRKYGSVSDDAIRKRVLDECSSRISALRIAARGKWHEINQQAQFDIKEKHYDKARRAYNQIIENFGIAEYVDRAKQELAKIPAQ